MALKLIRGSKPYVVVVALAMALLGLSLLHLSGNTGVHSSASTTTSMQAATTVKRLGVDGFGAVALTGDTPSDPTRSFCALLANTSTLQAKGMMGRTDLGGYDAMIFPFANDTTAQFYMFQVAVPLSVAFLDGAGKFVSSRDMPPCSAEKGSECPTYGATGAYRTAIEVLQGGFPNLGIGNDATVTYGGPCL